MKTQLTCYYATCDSSLSILHVTIYWSIKASVLLRGQLSLHLQDADLISQWPLNFKGYLASHHHKKVTLTASPCRYFSQLFLLIQYTNRMIACLGAEDLVFFSFFIKINVFQITETLHRTNTDTEKCIKSDYLNPRSRFFFKCSNHFRLQLILQKFDTTPKLLTGIATIPVSRSALIARGRANIT